MAPNTKGDKFGDHVRQLEVATLAFEQALLLLRPGGSFVVKVFDGEDANEFCQRVKKSFQKTKRVKPKATRGESVEFFLVCTGKNPN
jgi:23S rRNA (uridine2552-2'-O)-methyltransferase